MRLSPGRWTLLVAVYALVAGVGASAFACGRLATLNLSTGSGHAGITVTFTGVGFARAGTGMTPTPVVVHWESDKGPVLAEATPDGFGQISGSFTVPEARPGTYVIVAVQETPRRAPDAPPDQAPTLFPELGTPARTSFEVLAPGTVATVRASAAEGVDAPGGQGQLDSTVWFVLTAAFGAVAMSLFGGGLIAFIHQTRKSKEPATARWIPPGW